MQVSPATDNTRYGAVALTTHWLTFLLVTAIFTVGFIMEDLPNSPTRLKLFSYHKWTGVVIFLLVLWRIAWRWRVPPPSLPSSVPPWQQHAAVATHGLLYLLLLAVPLSGWLMSSAKGFQTVLFGVLPIPDLLDKNRELGKTLETVHYWLNKGLLGLIGLHAIAALHHHYVDRDTVLTRMVPGLKPRTRTSS
jgi:cytochrome b561